MNNRLGFLFFILVIGLANLKAFGLNTYIPDSVIHENTKQDTVRTKPNMYIDLATGLFINNTFGVHPLLNISVGFKLNANRFKVSYEYRFGDSKTNYQILENDTVKTINNYKANYIGLKYERIIFRNISHEISTVTGMGFDWIVVKENDYINNNMIIGGFAVNLGIGYSFFIKKKHGPHLELIYHYANLNTDILTKTNNNSFLIRLSYNFGNDYIKK